MNQDIFSYSNYDTRWTLELWQAFTSCVHDNSVVGSGKHEGERPSHYKERFQCCSISIDPVLAFTFFISYFTTGLCFANFGPSSDVLLCDVREKV